MFISIFVFVLLLIAAFIVGMLAQWLLDYYDREVKIPVFDQQEIHENCTVCISSCSKTGRYDVGWWHGGVNDLPVIPKENEDD